MRIGIDASRANKPNKTGTEWYSYHLIRELARIDDQNQYILYLDKPLAFDLTSHEGEVPSNFQAKILRWPFKYFWTQGRLSLEMLFNPPDVLYVPSHALPIIHPKDSVVTIHDIGFMDNTSAYEEKSLGSDNDFIKKMINLLVRFFTLGRYGANSRDYLLWSTEYALKKSRTVITISNFTKKELETKFPHIKQDVRVVYNGFDQSRFSKIHDKTKIQSTLDKYDIGDDFLLYVGRIEKKKNVGNLIHAFALLKERRSDIKTKLVLAGEASYGFDEIMQSAKICNIDTEIKHLGWVDDTDLACLYNATRGFVFPSLYEGFGIPILEAMSIGVPIACSGTSALPEIAGGSAIYFDPDDALSIAKSLERLIDDIGMRQELSETGENRAKNFNWNIAAKQILPILEKKS